MRTIPLVLIGAVVGGIVALVFFFLVSLTLGFIRIVFILALILLGGYIGYRLAMKNYASPRP